LSIVRHDADLHARLPRPLRHRQAEHLHAAAVRVGEAEQQAQRGGLARPVGAEQAEALARLDGEVDARHHFDVAVTLA